MKVALATSLKSKNAQSAQLAHAELAKQFVSIFGGGSNPGIVPAKQELVTSLIPLFPSTSRDGANLADILAASH